MEKQKQIDFLKSLCPTGKIEFNNLKETFVFGEINYENNVYFLGSVNDNSRRNSDEDIIFKNYFCVDFDIRANYQKVHNQILDDASMELYIEAIKQGLNKNGYGDRRYIVTSGNWFHIYYVGNWNDFTPEEYSVAVEYYYDEIDSIFENDEILKCDHSIKNIGRILRLPWSKNYNRVKKYWLEPKDVEIVDEQDVVSNKVDNIRQIYNMVLEKEVKTYVARQIRDINNPILDVILDIDIVKLVQDKTWLELQPDKKNFKSPKDGSNVGMFVHDNILYNTGTHYISDKHKWYNTFTFVREHYGLSNKETFQRFKDNYPELNENRKKKIEVGETIDIDFTTKIPFTRWLPIIDKRFGKYDYNILNIIIGESQWWKTERTFFQARENAKKYKVLYISLEMNPENMIRRFAMKRAWVNKFDWSEKNITENQQELIKNTISRIQKMENLKIVWMESPTIDDIEWLIKEYYMQWFSLIYIDNLWFIVGDTKEIEHTAEVSRRLKSLTNKYRLTINLIHHFNKWTSKDRDKPRGLADIRSSGKLENDADNVVNIRRDLSAEEEDEETRAQVTIILNKDRVFWQPCQQIIYFRKWEYIEENPFSKLYK